MTTGIEYTIWMRRPTNLSAIGSEAIELVSAVMRLSAGPDIGKITEPVREGFAYNFAAEMGGPFGQKWPRLAERTAREREQLGFPPWRPILFRTGSYKRSWVTRTDRYHFEKQHRAPGNILIINLGSIDPRAPTHEFGTEMPEHLLERESMLREASGMPSLGAGTGAVPPRPVSFIQPHFQQRTGRAIEFLLGEKAKKVRGAQ